jgi:hypothetical protein
MVNTNPECLYAADCNDHETPKNEEVTPTSWLAYYPPLSEHEGHYTLDPLRCSVESVLGLTKSENPVKLVGSESEKSIGGNKNHNEQDIGGKMARLHYQCLPVKIIALEVLWLSSVGAAFQPRLAGDLSK